MDTAIGGEETAAAGVKGGIVFKYRDGGFDSVEGGTSAGKDGIAGLESAANAGLVRGSVGLRNGPCASVYEEGGSVGRSRGHLVMVVHRDGVGGRMESCRNVQFGTEAAFIFARFHV